MKYLLDTHTLIWSILDTDKLSEKAKKILEDGKNEVFVSTLSFWEISMKTMVRKFSFNGLEPSEVPSLASKIGYSLLSLDSGEAASYHRLPFRGEHRDPFDRMLIWQALSRRLALVSKDKDFTLYTADGLRLVW